MDDHSRLTPCRIALAALLLSAVATVSAAEIFTRAILGGGEIPGTPPIPVPGGSMTSTTGLSEFLWDANNLARADASVGAQLGNLRVEVRSVPPTTGGASAEARFGDSWHPIVGSIFCDTAINCAAFFSIKPVLHIEGTIGPTGIPSGDLQLEYDLIGSFGSGTLSLAHLDFSIFQDGSSSGEVCTNVACSPLGIAGVLQPDGSRVFLANISLPNLGSSGVDVIDLAARFGFDGVTEAVRLSAQLDEGRCCLAGFVDFFNTVTVGLQAGDPGSESLWVNNSGRVLVVAADNAVDEPGTLLLLVSSLGWGALIFSWRKNGARRRPLPQT